ncbi:ribonuclease P protein component, partial [Burkholderia multivorans]
SQLATEVDDLIGKARKKQNRGRRTRPQT